MAEEIIVELELTKPLDKYTAKELRQLAIDQIPQITGASGMSKEELVAEIKRIFNIQDEGEAGKSPYKDQILRIKKEIRVLRDEKSQLPASEKQKRNLIRRKIHALKKRTRRLAAV
ncbi:MAG: hypothetical protein ACOC0U_05145 [Desulfovibrionales bacterium]